MFESELKEKLLRIFGLKRVEFYMESESREQECLFVNVEDTKTRFKDGEINIRVIGSVRMFADLGKMPFGYFAKCISLADNEDTKNFFFSELESNSKIYGNIVERSFSFTYFFNSQFDPKIGTITSLEQEFTQE